MKKAIKKYLTQLHENEEKGFSLVELIIVMAIMAILVGVVASQVIPYMEKSRQSKDQQQISSLATDITAAIASSAITAKDVTTATEIGDLYKIAGTAPTDADAVKFIDEFLSLRNDASDVTEVKKAIIKKMKSKASGAKADGTGTDIKFTYDTSTSKLTLKVYKAGTSTEVKKLTVESE